MSCIAEPSQYSHFKKALLKDSISKALRVLNILIYRIIVLIDHILMEQYVYLIESITLQKKFKDVEQVSYVSIISKKLHILNELNCFLKLS